MPSAARLWKAKRNLDAVRSPFTSAGMTVHPSGDQTGTRTEGPRRSCMVRRDMACIAASEPMRSSPVGNSLVPPDAQVHEEGDVRSGELQKDRRRAAGRTARSPPGDSPKSTLGIPVFV